MSFEFDCTYRCGRVYDTSTELRSSTSNKINVDERDGMEIDGVLALLDHLDAATPALKGETRACKVKRAKLLVRLNVSKDQHERTDAKGKIHIIYVYVKQWKKNERRKERLSYGPGKPEYKPNI